MRKTTGLRAIIVASGLGLTCGIGLAEGNQVTTNQLLRLKAVPVPVVLPAYVPDGYKLVECESEVDTVRNGMHSAPANDYTLVYKNADGQQFQIYVADSAFGDEGPDPTQFKRQYALASPAVGNGKMLIQDRRYPGGFRSDYISLKRLGNTKAMMIVSSKNTPASEIQKMYASLRVLHR